MSERSCRETVKNRAAGVCERCGFTQPAQMHHRKNRSQGGGWTPENITHICVKCHTYVTEHPEVASSEGFNVKSWESEAAIPVLVHRKWWARLKMDGTYNKIPSPLRTLE